MGARCNMTMMKQVPLARWKPLVWPAIVPLSDTVAGRFVFHRHRFNSILPEACDPPIPDAGEQLQEKQKTSGVEGRVSLRQMDAVTRA